LSGTIKGQLGDTYVFPEIFEVIVAGPKYRCRDDWELAVPAFEFEEPSNRMNFCTQNAGLVLTG
jgi:hypothetical protein